MRTYKTGEISPQSITALGRMIETRGPEPLRDLLTEVRDLLARGEDVTIGSETYNGWANHETWAVSLHLGNDQGLYNDTRQRLARAYIEAESPWADNIADEDKRFRTSKAADALKDWVTDELLSPDFWRDDMGAPMPKDLEMMRVDCGSLWRVDWSEIAGNWLGDIHADELAELAQD